MKKQSKLITVAIHSYEKAVILKTLLAKEGIESVIHNVNLIQPVISSGVRVRIHEDDLPMALKIIESASSLSSNSDMPSVSKILIPIDFSDYSYKACEIGFDFAHRNGGEIILLHTYVSMGYAALMPFDSDEYESENITITDDKMIDKICHKKMKDFTLVLEKNIESGLLPNIKFTSIVSEGVPENAVLNYAKEFKATLIVMGTRGKSKKEAELIGSVTAEVLDSCKFPVFTVPENLTFTSVSQIQNVVFFSNLNQQDLLSFDVFARMFGDQKFKITVIPIYDQKKMSSASNAIETLLNYCKNNYPNYSFEKKLLEDHDFLKDFDSYVSGEKIDLILVPNKKRSIFARLFNPSIAHKMLFHSDTAMLVVPVS